MKPHPRIRKTVKWGGAVVTVLLVVVWIGSGWIEAGWASRSGYHLAISQGEMRMMYSGPADPPGSYVRPGFVRRRSNNGVHVWKIGPWYHQESRPTFAWRVRKDRFGWHIPVYFPLVPITGITLLAWRLDTLARRRARVGRCPKCNYDRTGLAAGAVCPECGIASNPP